jgi:hypothetical protein
LSTTLDAASRPARKTAILGRELNRHRKNHIGIRAMVCGRGRTGWRTLAMIPAAAGVLPEGDDDETLTNPIIPSPKHILEKQAVLAADQPTSPTTH